jgi:hypothetical protein
MLWLLRYDVYKEYWPTRLTAHLTGCRERWTAAQITFGVVLGPTQSQAPIVKCRVKPTVHNCPLIPHCPTHHQVHLDNQPASRSAAMLAVSLL